MKSKKLFTYIYIYIYILILLASASYAYDFTDNSQENFDGGVYNHTFFNSSGFVQLNSSRLNGTYTSQIFDAGSVAEWGNIYWIQGGYYQQELPNNQQIETGLGGVNMSSNMLLFHLNNYSSFGENSTLFYDFSGNGNNGTCSGSECPALISSGKFGKAYSFGGSSVITCNTVSLGSAATFEVWGRHSAANPGMIWNHPSNVGSTYFDLWFVNNGVYLNTGDSYSNSFKYANGTNFNQVEISYNIWHHYIVVLDPTANKALFYFDGINVANATYKNPTSTTARTFSLGGPAGYRWNGQIDEFAIYNRVLSFSEIASRYERGILRLNISVRICNDSNCAGEIWIDVNDTSPQSLNLVNSSFFQYIFEFETDDINYTPELYNVTINYEPDTLPPNITVIKPLDYSSYYTSWVEANVILNEAGNCNYSLDGFAYLEMDSISSTEFYANMTNLTQGLHNITFNCTDLSGNSKTALRHFTVSFNPGCLNGLKDQDESDVDCGGICGSNCNDTQMCNVNSDCLNNVCESGVCVSCSDGMLNNNETDIDCGGPNCAGCAIGKNCIQVSDCDGATSCSGGVCCSCSDWLLNQGEDLVDCGGPYCSACSYLLYLYDDCGNPSNETHLMQGTDFVFVGGINSSLSDSEKSVSYHNDKVIYRYSVDNMYNYKVKIKLLQPTEGGRIQNILVDSYMLDSARSMPEYNPVQYSYDIPFSSYSNDSSFDLIFEKTSGPNAVCSEIELWKSTSVSSSLQESSYLFDFNNPLNYTYNNSRIVVENSSARLINRLVYGENNSYYDFNPVASDLSYGSYNLKTNFYLSKTYNYYNYSIELKRNGIATGMFQIAVNNISNIINVTNASTIFDSYQVYTINIPAYMITDDTPEIWTLTKSNILFRMDGTLSNNSYYRNANDNLNNTGWILDNNDYYHMIIGYENTSSGSGIIETNDLIIDNLLKWTNITIHDNDLNISYDYSTDSGAIWNSVPSSGNISNVSTSNGRIKFRANITANGILYDINVTYYTFMVANCSDGIKNQDETDIDCGGSICSKCSNGKSCLVGSDCQSGLCSNGICNAGETGNGGGNGGGSGGGGGSGSGSAIVQLPEEVLEPTEEQPAPADEYLTKTVDSILANTQIEINFDDDVYSLKLTINRYTKGVLFKFKELYELPNIIPPLNNTYLYLEINAENLSNDVIDNASIQFKVNKSWLLTNNFDSATLYRYVNNNWVKLETKEINRDNNSVYYEAETPGFSYFAIVGEKVDVNQNINGARIKYPAEDKKERSFLWIWIISIIVAVLVITFILKTYRLTTGQHRKSKKSLIKFENNMGQGRYNYLSNLIDKKVFTRDGFYCGKVTEVELDLKKSRIGNIKIKIDKESYLYKHFKSKKGRNLPYKLVESVGDIVIIKHIDEKDIKNNES